MRYAHTDVSCPDFTPHRRESTLNPHAPASESKYQRRTVTYGLSALATIPGLYLGKESVKGYLHLFAPDRFSKVTAKIEVDLSGVQRGFGMTVMWQGKPVFIRHRTAEEIAELNETSMGDLRDPQVSIPKYFTLIKIMFFVKNVPCIIIVAIVKCVLFYAALGVTFIDTYYVH